MRTARAIIASACVLFALAVEPRPAAAQTCQCTPAQFAGACKATVAHQQGLNAIKVTANSPKCALVEWTYKDGSKDREFVTGGVAHKITLFDLAKPKPEIGAATCNICAAGGADIITGEPRMTFDAKPVAPSSGNLAEDTKRALQQEFAAKPNAGKEDWDAVLAKVDQGNKQFAEQQRLLALQRAEQERLRRAQEEADRLEREAQLAEQQFYSEPEPEYQGPNMLDILNGIREQVDRETYASKQRLDRTIANAEAQAARERAQRARDEVQRLADDSRRRMQDLQTPQQQGNRNVADNRGVAIAQAPAPPGSQPLAPRQNTNTPMANNGTGTNAPSPPQQVASAPTEPPGPPLFFYLRTGLLPNDKDVRNQICVSSLMPTNERKQRFTVDSAPVHQRVTAQAESLHDRFRQKCSLRRALDPNSPIIAEIGSREDLSAHGKWPNDGYHQVPLP